MVARRRPVPARAVHPPRFGCPQAPAARWPRARGRGRSGSGAGTGATAEDGGATTSAPSSSDGDAAPARGRGGSRRAGGEDGRATGGRPRCPAGRGRACIDGPASGRYTPPVAPRRPWTRTGSGSGAAATGTGPRWQPRPPSPRSRPSRPKVMGIDGSDDRDAPTALPRRTGSEQDQACGRDRGGNGRERGRASPKASTRAPPRRRPRAGSPTSRGRPGPNRRRRRRRATVGAPTRLRRQRQGRTTVRRRRESMPVVPRVTDKVMVITQHGSAIRSPCSRSASSCSTTSPVRVPGRWSATCTSVASRTSFREWRRRSSMSDADATPSCTPVR